MSPVKNRGCARLGARNKPPAQEKTLYMDVELIQIRGVATKTKRCHSGHSTSLTLLLLTESFLRLPLVR